MSYPPRLYQGTSGELTVSYRPAGRPPEIVNTRTGNRVHYLATGQYHSDEERQAFFERHDTYWV
jgi:hypothetical protein